MIYRVSESLFSFTFVSRERTANTKGLHEPLDQAHCKQRTRTLPSIKK